MRLRPLKYLALQCAGLLLTLPIQVIAVIEALTFLLWPSEIRRGIRIVDPSTETLADFVKSVDEALGLIERNDPMRFARLKSEIKRIANGPVRTGASYSRRFKVCRIDLCCFHIDEDREAWITVLACVLIHEATHGLLMRR